ncbi:MarR family transcriptional regulator, partial [Mesorhizobium sp. M7A.F.Ca.CA.002.05.1.1]|uniref:MarR family transcriptional regulator n=1 Tax=Mesorhizobium sp. M7A.F.Ca.CA.002.05.1.1 TaxID=2496704 RepID=UPI000FD327DF
MAAAEIPNLTESARAVLRVLAAHGPVTRPKLGAMLDLSKPTMSAAVSELSALGLVASRGLERGAIGRTATVYGIGPGAGYAIGIDFGAAQVR